MASLMERGCRRRRRRSLLFWTTTAAAAVASTTSAGRRYPPTALRPPPPSQPQQQQRQRRRRTATAATSSTTTTTSNTAMPASSWWQQLSHVPHRTHQLDYGPHHPHQRFSRHLDGPDDDDQQYVTDDDDDHVTRQYVQYSSNATNVRYQPLRIHFITDILQHQRPLLSSAVQAELDDLLDRALPAAATAWTQHLSVVPVQGRIVVPADACYGAYYSSADDDNTVDPILINQTIYNADLVVIVSAHDAVRNPDGTHTTVCGQGDGTLAIASACELDQYDRPVIGFINFCLGFARPASDMTAYLQDVYGSFLQLNLNSDNDNNGDRVVLDYAQVATHELAHILAFSSWLFKYYRQPDGTPWTPRPFQVADQIACVDGTTQRNVVFPSTSTVQRTTGSSSSSYNNDDDSNGADGTIAYSIVTPRVKQVARNHINCASMPGARLEGPDTGGACIGSHWHERWFFGELMSPALSISSENVLSALSLALMEDSGWYRVNYRNVGTPTFGLAAGCDFVNEYCIVNDQVPAWGRDMFCATPIRFDEYGRITEESLNHVTCDPSHRTWTVCDLWDASNMPASSLAYFPETTRLYFTDSGLRSSFSLAEYCPIPAKSLGMNCQEATADTYIKYYDAEVVGTGSNCYDAFTVDANTGANTYRPACLHTTCDALLHKIVVGGSNGESVVCEYDGQVLSLPGLAGTAQFQCPRLATVCPALQSCPGSCSGRGICVYNDDGDAAPSCVCLDSNASSTHNAGCFVDDEDNGGSGSNSTGGSTAGSQPTPEPPPADASNIASGVSRSVWAPPTSFALVLTCSLFLAL